ncbi:phage major capsid protein [Marinobacter sp. OP 3.4]|uniref:phage major capsid protein n=1 Tax=Marinobacter sp. OP 3.4 TaxID=3076501 RepID=UPI002E1F9600
MPTIQVYDYEKGKDLTYDTPESTSTELVIDQGKHFNFTCDDVDKHQSDLNLMDMWSNDASEQIKIAIDRDVLGDIYGSVAAENTGATAGKISGNINLGAAAAPVSITKDNILDYIVDCGTVLDEQNVPEEGRFIILPAWACGLVKKSDLKDASLAGDGTSILRNGRMGMIDRFTVYKSNLLATTDETGTDAFHMLAGHKSGLTFASQMTKMETLRNPNRFGDLMRGLNVYGYEVIKPESLVHLYGVKG